MKCVLKRMQYRFAVIYGTPSTITDSPKNMFNSFICRFIFMYEYTIIHCIYICMYDKYTYCISFIQVIYNKYLYLSFSNMILFQPGSSFQLLPRCRTITNFLFPGNKVFIYLIRISLRHFKTKVF